MKLLLFAAVGLLIAMAMGCDPSQFKTPQQECRDLCAPRPVKLYAPSCNASRCECEASK